MAGQLVEVGSALEDSELTITIEWHGRPRGGLVAGLTVLAPAVTTASVDLHVIDLQSYVGELRLTLVGENGRDLVTAVVPVRRRKLASDADMSELERHWAALHLGVRGALGQRITGSAQLQSGTPSAPQWAIMMADMIRPLRTATGSIRRQPKQALEGASERIASHRLRRGSASATLSVLQGARSIVTRRQTWGPDRGAQALMVQDARVILRHVRRLREVATEVGAELHPQLAHEFARIEQDLMAIKTVGHGSRARPRQAVLHDPRYRLVHRAGIVARRSAMPGGTALRALRPPTSELYEHWCTWALVEELADEDLLPSILDQLSRPWQSKEILLRRRAPKIVLGVQYDMAVGKWHHRPDLVLRVEAADRVVILDVKYRGEGEGLAQVPPDAVNELHRYRDAYILTHPDVQHKTVWAAILHPAPGLTDDDWTVDKLYELVRNPGFRVGGVPLSPSLRHPLRDYLVAVGLLDANREATGIDLRDLGAAIRR